jgi:hypothetical protein
MIENMNKETQFLIYNTPQENIKIDVVVKDETIWLTQKAMAALFGVQTPAISRHLKNIFEEGEIDEKVVISKMETTTIHGAIADKTQTKDTNFYNLDAIISVGYRVNSAKAPLGNIANRKFVWQSVRIASLGRKKHEPSIRHSVRNASLNILK